MTLPSVTPRDVAEAIAANLLTDVTVPNGSPVALGHAYAAYRKRYAQPWPVAALDVLAGGSREYRHTIGANRQVAGLKRIELRPRILLLWPLAEDTADGDGAEDGMRWLTLTEAVKQSLRMHTSLGGLVIKCAEDDVTVRQMWEPDQVPLWRAEIDFTVLYQIASEPTG